MDEEFIYTNTILPRLTIIVIYVTMTLRYCRTAIFTILYYEETDYGNQKEILRGKRLGRKQGV